MAEDTRDTVVINGEEWDIDSGLDAEDVRASMKHLYPSITNAHIEKVDNADGTVTWLVTEKGGDKGLSTETI